MRKTTEVVKVARRDQEQFDFSTEEFKLEVERHLTRRDSEPWEIIYFKIYQNRLPVSEQALDTSNLLGK
jgi:hypothetical protein